MPMDVLLAWFEAHQGLAAWLALGGGVVVAALGWLFRAYRLGTKQRKVVRAHLVAVKEAVLNGAVAVELAASELSEIAHAANSAGRDERQDLAGRAGAHLEAIREMERRAPCAELKTELACVCNGIKDFQIAVLGWHGVHDSDSSKRDAGFTAIERLNRSGRDLRKNLRLIKGK
ncbi:MULTISPECIES: hypothetical protein [Pseudomonas]|uniref:hypothetical protein n=1 Tax=Pseudomonas TaxID=286 RepID=UPI00132F217A|nr:hypothetical protein [Pseudomonas sp. DTU12.1]QHG24401.1 hypothetical protein GDV60_16655 [Pseudomonas sp. DTU12.1]